MLLIWKEDIIVCLVWFVGAYFYMCQSIVIYILHIS